MPTRIALVPRNAYSSPSSPPSFISPTVAITSDPTSSHQSLQTYPANQTSSSPSTQPALPTLSSTYTHSTHPSQPLLPVLTPKEPQKMASEATPRINAKYLETFKNDTIRPPRQSHLPSWRNRHPRRQRQRQYPSQPGSPPSPSFPSPPKLLHNSPSPLSPLPSTTHTAENS